MTRFKSDKTEEMVKNAKQAKKIVEKHAAEFLRMTATVAELTGRNITVSVVP